MAYNLPLRATSHRFNSRYVMLCYVYTKSCSVQATVCILGLSERNFYAQSMLRSESTAAYID